jgi:hypothetical protein
VSHANPEAARLADKLRTAMKDRALRGPAIADEVERLTGVRPAYAAQWISRRLSGTKPLIRIHPDLYVLAEIAGLDPDQLILDSLTETPEESAALVDDNLRRMGSAGLSEPVA